MRIAFDYQAFCRQSAGGISRYFCRLAQQLQSGSDAVGVFAPFYRNQYLTQIPERLVHGIYLRSYPPRTAEAVVGLNRWLSRRQVRNWHPEVLHETYFAAKSVAPAGCPVVVTVFDMIPELEAHGGETTPATLRSTAKYACVARADRVICISEQTRQDLIRLFGTAPDKVSVAYLGCDNFAQADPAMALGARSDRPFLLYVGLRGGYKNFAGMLRAVASSPRLTGDFDIVAFGGGAFSAAEQALIGDLGFRPNQVTQRAGADHILAHHYRTAAAFVYPSSYEGFGLPPLEAMAQGCPVICSDRSAIPEVVGNAGAYFDPDHADSIAGAIERVVYSPARAAELIAAGKERVSLFTWDRCAQLHRDVYRSLVNA